jgi:hypothetical protein
MYLDLINQYKVVLPELVTSDKKFNTNLHKYQIKKHEIKKQQFRKHQFKVKK